MNSTPLSPKRRVHAKSAPPTIVCVGSYRGLPPSVRLTQQRNDLVRLFGIPFRNLLHAAEKLREAIHARLISQGDKQEQLLDAWFGFRRFNERGLKAAVWKLFAVRPGEVRDRHSVRALAIAEQLVRDALFGRGLWKQGSRGGPRNVRVVGGGEA
jgi:hypothetical protein